MTTITAQTAVHPAERPHLPLLTTLRFFAAFQVLAMHLVPQPLRGSLWYGPLISAGDEAVIFFFVLSGFIMSYVYSGKTEDAPFALPASRFWIARMARLLPAYVAGLILTLPMFIYAAFVAQTLPQSTFWIGLVLVPTFLQSWYPPTVPVWNGVAWTLSIEWMFYALFPWLQTVTGRIGRWTFLVGAWVLLLAASIIRAAVDATRDPTVPGDWLWFGGSFPPYYLPIFLLGMAVGRLFLFGPRLSTTAHARLFVVASLLTVALLCAREAVPGWAVSGPVIVPLFCCVIYGGARTGKSLSLLAGPTLVLLGEASYGLYVLHPGVTWWSGWLAKQSGLYPPFPLSAIVLAIVAIAASILCYRYLEVPWRRRILGWRWFGLVTSRRGSSGLRA